MSTEIGAPLTMKPACGSSIESSFGCPAAGAFITVDAQGNDAAGGAAVEN